MAEPEKPNFVRKPNVNIQSPGQKPVQNTPADPRIPVPNPAQRPQAENVPQEHPDVRAAQAKAAAQALSDSAKAAQVIKHVWTSEDTYSSLAFKFYGSIKEPYWRLIYEHNKAIIGKHPNDIRVGLEIEIPPLPDELKKK